jgi:hypothetical protein
MRIVFLHILLLFVFQRKPASESIDAFGVKLSFLRPDKVTWHTFQKRRDDSLGVGTISFRSLPVVDDKGRAFQPVVAIIYERLPDSINVEEYATAKRTAARTNWTVLRSTAPEPGEYDKATYFDGEYEFGGEMRTIIVGYLVYGRLGVQVIGDCPAHIFSQVEDDMRKCVHSISFSSGG